MKIIIYFLLFHHALSSNLEFHLDYNYQKFKYQTDYSYSDLYSNAIYEMTNDNFELQDTIWLRTGAGLSFVTFTNGWSLCKKWKCSRN